MIKGLVFGFIVWTLVSIGIFVFGRLTRNEKRSVIQSIIYGLVTAIVAGAVIAGVIALF